MRHDNIFTRRGLTPPHTQTHTSSIFFSLSRSSRDQILYALVSRGTIVLAECSATQGNANTIARRILERLPASDSVRQSYTQDRHLFHILTEEGLTFLCMSDEGMGRRVPFAFLEEIRSRFTQAYGSAALTALAYAYNTEFSRILHQQMEYFSFNPNADVINRVRGEVSDVKNIMMENIEKVLDRGEKIELLIDKTDQLQGDAFAFRRNTRKLKREMWWRNFRLACGIGIGVILLVYFISAMACGMKLNKC